MINALILTSLALDQNDSYPLSEISITTQADSKSSGTQVTELDNISGTVRYVYAGSFDVTKDGDVIEVFGMTEEHWKKIIVPQLTLDNMPLVKVYYRLNSTSASTHEMWRESADALDTFPTLSAVYDEQSVFILYKKVYNDYGTTNYLCDGEYKIVIIK